MHMASHARSSASGIFGHLGCKKARAQYKAIQRALLKRLLQIIGNVHEEMILGHEVEKTKLPLKTALRAGHILFQKKIQQRKALATSSSSKSKISAATFVHTSENQTKELIHRFSCNKPRHGNIVRTAPWALHDANNELQDQTCITSLE